MIKNLIAVATLTTLFVSLTPLAAGSNANSTVVPADKVKWGYLNPLRGDKSPGAADLWGDRTKDGATGMLVRFNKGFSSPPHIHNISYRGVVIKGMMHNDDPNAEKAWMPTASFWTQPAGENHITAAEGVTNLIYLEIDSGPYLVKPSKEKFDNGEVALNLHHDNIVWSLPQNMLSASNDKVQMANLWGNKNKTALSGSLVKLPTGYQGKIKSESEEFKVVVIKGKVGYHSAEQQNEVTLLPGSYFSSNGQFIHHLSAVEETILYVRANAKYNF